MLWTLQFLCFRKLLSFMCTEIIRNEWLMILEKNLHGIPPQLNQLLCTPCILFLFYSIHTNPEWGSLTWQSPARWQTTIRRCLRALRASVDIQLKFAPNTGGKLLLCILNYLAEWLRHWKQREWLLGSFHSNHGLCCYSGHQWQERCTKLHPLPTHIA